MTLSTSSFNGDAKPPRRRRAAQRKSLAAGAATFLALVVIGALARQIFPSLASNIAADAVKSASAAYYLSYCHGAIDDYTIYNDLDHLSAPIKQADVLFLGSSHVQFAFRRDDLLQPFFLARNLRYYNLAFLYNEHDRFPVDVINKFDLHPKWLIINADPFFTGEISPFAAKVVAGTRFDAQKFRFETQAAFEVRRRLHRVIPFLSILKGTDSADWIQYRSAEDGVMQLAAYQGRERPIKDFTTRGASVTPEILENARRFQSEMEHRGSRMVLTSIPPSSPVAAQALAAALHVPLILPHTQGLRTVDGSHLTDASAAAYTRAFLEELSPVLDNAEITDQPLQR